MFFIQNNPLFKLFFFLSSKRKKQLYFLIFLLIINGILESFSIASIIPFLSIIAMKNDINNIPIIGNILNILGINDLSQSLLFITILFCIFISLSTFFRLFNVRYIMKLTANLEIELSRRIFRNNIFQPYLSYINKNSSEMITITVDKVSATASALCSLLNLVGGIILGLFIVGSLTIINWKIVVSGIVFIVLFYLVVYKRVKKIVSTNGKLMASLGPKRLRLLQEVFFGFRDVIVNGTERIYLDLFDEYDKEMKMRNASSSFIALFPRFLIEGLVIFILVIIGYNVSLLDLELLPLIPVFASIVYAFQRLLPLIQQIYSTWANYRTKYPSICEVISELENNQNNKNILSQRQKFNFNQKIIFKNIHFSYNKSNLVLENINFVINKGDHIGIYGETGSGKSTLLDMVIGLLPPTKGEILIDDIDIYKKNFNKYWTSSIAHVSQNIYLKEGTIAENIAYGDSLEEIDFELLKKAAKFAHIYQYIKSTENGFKTNVGERGIKLSGGQRQRIAIARALYNAKDILVLDEATSALDHKTEEEIINSLKIDKNLTILMVTHRLKSLKNCNRVFKVIDNNVIEEKKFDF